MSRTAARSAVWEPDRQDRPGGPWYPWYRYQVQTNFLDGRLTVASSILTHLVNCVAYPLRPLGRRLASRVDDRVEY